MAMDIVPIWVQFTPSLENEPVNWLPTRCSFSRRFRRVGQGGRLHRVRALTGAVLEGRVRVALEPTDYARACDAHKAGLGVRVTGVVEKVGKFWKLMAPTNFETLNH